MREGLAMRITVDTRLFHWQMRLLWWALWYLPRKDWISRRAFRVAMWCGTRLARSARVEGVEPGDDRSNR